MNNDQNDNEIEKIVEKNTYHRNRLSHLRQIRGCDSKEGCIHSKAQLEENNYNQCDNYCPNVCYRVIKNEPYTGSGIYGIISKGDYYGVVLQLFGDKFVDKISKPWEINP